MLMYIEISEMGLKIISPLLKKIAIYIDSELLSSPMFNYTKQLIMLLEMCHNIPQKNGVSVLPQFIFETNI